MAVIKAVVPEVTAILRMLMSGEFPLEADALLGRPALRVVSPPPERAAMVEHFD
jgi:hypothetical protein